MHAHGVGAKVSTQSARGVEEWHGHVHDLSRGWSGRVAFEEVQVVPLVQHCHLQWFPVLRTAKFSREVPVRP